MSERAIADPGALGWVETSPGFWEFSKAGGGIEEAPEDSRQYARQDAAWSEVVIPEVPEFVETDPTVPAHVKGITQAQITSWDTEFVEADPTVPSHVKSITTTNISHWDTAWEEATAATVAIADLLTRVGALEADTGGSYTAGNGITINGNEIKMSGSYSGTFTANTVVGSG